MKINKKYEPQIKRKIKQISSEAHYPIFIDSYKKLTGKNIAPYLFQLIWWKDLEHRLGKSLSPLFIYDTSINWIQEILKWKEKLPFFAKLQRLSSHKAKILKKNLSVYSQIFWVSEGEENPFRLTSQKVRPLLNKLQENKIWKLKDKLVYWDVSTQTIVQSNEILWKEEKVKKLVVKCFVETKNDVFPLVVTDPMLLFSDVWVVVHENDKRYKKHIGKKIIIPVINKSIPVFWEQWIDTIRDNGIQRLNPFFDENALERVKSYHLPFNENYIDDNGLFIEKVEKFWWKSAFDFTENIVETLWAIWNLASQEEIVQKIPYSKLTWQRLIKKIIPTIVIDYSSVKEDFEGWISDYYPDWIDLVSKSSEILIDSNNLYAQKLTLLEHNDEISLWKGESLHKASLFWKILWEEIRKGHFWWGMNEQFTIDDIIDLLYLLPQEEWDDIENRYGVSHKDLLEERKKYKELSSDQLVEYIEKELKKLSFVKEEDDWYILDIEAFFGKNNPFVVSCNDDILKALTLYEKLENKIILRADELSQETLLLFLFFLFLGHKDFPTLFPFVKEDIKFPSFPEKYQWIVEKYWWETIKLFLIEQKKYSEEWLEKDFDYLKHLWNLFKVLYENKAFDSEEVSYTPDGKDIWMLTQWKEFKVETQGIYVQSPEFPEILEKIKILTRKQFTWYLTLIKQEQSLWAFKIAWEIFLWILEILAPIISEFVSMIENVVWEIKYPTEIIIPWKKDYKIHLLFDILQGIEQEKMTLDLKKHVPIQLCVQANPDIVSLISSYEPSINLLFKVKEVIYIPTNEEYPEGYHAFNILDMTLWILPCDLKKQEDELEKLEKELKSKQQTAEYIRSILMALASSPLTPQEKIQAKKNELEDLKLEIQKIEIKIQKIRMQKKTA